MNRRSTETQRNKMKLNPPHRPSPPLPGPALIGCVCLALLTLTGCQSNVTPGGDQATLTIAGERFTLDLAVTAEQRYQGLSGVEHIPDDGGMLFVFPDAAVRHFVMRRCLVPIDAVFLDSGGRVTAIHAMQVEPTGTPEARLKRYSSAYPARFVIELRGGRAGELGLKRGQKLDLPLERLKALAS